MAKKLSVDESARAAVREIGWVTLIRLTLYYVVAGVILLILTAVFPGEPLQLSETGTPPTALGGALEWAKSELAAFPSGSPRWVDALVQILGAVVLVLPIAFTYVRTRTRLKFDHSLVQTVIVLPVVVTAILVVVRDSLALAFSLAGIVAAVRFRNNLKESGDAVYIFGAIGIGFATGIHALSVAAVLSVCFVVLELALWKFDFSADFERTFARLCLPSGADMVAISKATGEHPIVRQLPLQMESDDGTVMRIYVDRVEEARPKVEAVLQRDAKRWTLAQVKPNDEGAGLLEYRVRPRKSVGLEGLREHLLKEGAPHVVAAD